MSKQTESEVTKNKSERIEQLRRSVELKPHDMPDKERFANKQKLSKTSDFTVLGPYNFVPFKAHSSLTVDPVFHDQFAHDQVSGELHIRMETLTPTLVGNEQYDVGANPDLLELIKKEYKNRFGLDPRDNLKADKKVIEPLILADQSKNDVAGPVLINGTAFKGMLRQDVGALFSSPLERVAEQTFSYRPNVDLSKRRKFPQPLLIREIRERNDSGHASKVRAVLLKNMLSIGYIHPDAFENIPENTKQRLRDLWFTDKKERIAQTNQSWIHQSRLEYHDLIHLKESEIKLTQSRILKRGRNPRGKTDPCQLDNDEWIVVPNLNGIDHKGILNQAFYDKNRDDHSLRRTLETKSREGYEWMLVKYEESPIDIPELQLNQYYRTLLHLYDIDEGHLRNHPLAHRKKDNDQKPVREEVKQSIKDYLKNGVLPGDVLFVEMNDTGESPRPIGNHVYYRTRYRDSIHLSSDPDLQGSDEDALGNKSDWKPTTLREQLCPRPKEQRLRKRPSGDSAPEQLSMARNLFGYVGTTEGQYDKKQPTTFGIGVERDRDTGKVRVTDFSQLAGRLAFNIAVEQDHKAPLAKRFLNIENEMKSGLSGMVPLRALGSPKPSAVEFYLQQDPKRIARRDDDGILSTYGDTLHDPSAGQLRGRKFYLHQPVAKFEPSTYEAGLKDHNHSSWDDNLSRHDANWRMEEDENAFKEIHGSIARFVSRPGRHFCLTLRFSQLRKWELGSILLCMTPTESLWREFANELNKQADKKHRQPGNAIIEWLEKYSKDVDSSVPLLANKIGHGRPIGLGSVKFSIDGAYQISTPTGTSSHSMPQTVVRQEISGLHHDALSQLAELILDPRNGIDVDIWIHEIVLPWLEGHRYAGRKRYDYPRPTRSRSTNVFDYHSDLRKEHAKGRKQYAPKDGKRSQHGLREPYSRPSQSTQEEEAAESWRADPTNLTKARHLIELRIKLGKYEDAVRVYDRLLEDEDQLASLSDSSPKNIDDLVDDRTYQNLLKEKADLLHEMGDTKRALKTWDQWQKIDSESRKEDNKKTSFSIESFEASGLEFFGDFEWRLSPQMNVLLGKNGYGKTHLLRLLVGLLKEDDSTKEFFNKNCAPSAESNASIRRGERTLNIQRVKFQFNVGPGKLPVLAIPDARYVNKSANSFDMPDDDEDDTAKLVDTGADHFLKQRPYENLISSLLWSLGADERAEPDDFKLPIFQIITKVIRHLTETNDGDSGSGEEDRFAFKEIQELEGGRFKILVTSEGISTETLPLQKASQGTLSILVMIGMIYRFLRSVNVAREITEWSEVPYAEGIVFIDEIDAHIHPSWQQKIIGILRDTFPNVQFILTAHSPLVIAGCRPGEVNMLRKSDKSQFELEPVKHNLIGEDIQKLYGQFFSIDRVDADETYIDLVNHLGMEHELQTEIDLLEKSSDPTLKQKARLHLLKFKTNALKNFPAIQKARQERNDPNGTIEYLKLSIKDLELELELAQGRLLELLSEKVESRPNDAEARLELSELQAELDDAN